MSKAKILVVEDDNLLRNLLLESINLEGHDVSIAESAEVAEELFAKHKFDILLTDVNLPGKSGLDLLLLATQHNPDIYSIVITGFGTIDTAVQAMKLGATDFLCKPIALHDLLSAVRVAVGKLQNPGVVPAKVPSPVSNSAIIAQSPEMLKLLEEIKTIAPYKLNALITGETGTGKELIARAIHETSPRSKHKFVALNCAAIPENLLEDELFGHVKGAFTGAQTDRQGRFEQATDGTLFLDEVGDMNLALQAKLLRVLQESEFERLGSSKTIKVDVRVVAATSANLERKIADGSFRMDLFHRLNVVHLQIPALRDRSTDILPIANGLLKRFCDSSGLPPKILSAETEKRLLAYDFPGNVRQLRNCMERAAVFSGINEEIKPEHLPEEIKNQISTNLSFASNFSQQIPDEGIDFSVVVSNVERELLLQTLDKTGGNKMQAAKLLNMKRTTLVEKIKRLEIEEPSNLEPDNS
jgi:DNA-binding NtrC family response regulator